ncbi:MAG: histidine phosphatase family protein [Desulfosarcina sp.]
MIEIFLIRHGQASFGQPAYDCLSPLGERQAALLGDYLNKTGNPFDAVYSGTLKRHVQTAKIALARMNGHGRQDIQFDANFNEFDGSDQVMDGLCAVIREDPELSEQMKRIHTDHGAIARIFDVAQKARMMPDDEIVRNREAQQFRDRIGAALDNLVSRVGENKRVAVFTSGGPTAVALRQTLQTSSDQTIRLGWQLRNTSMTVLRYHQEQLWLVLFNCVAHLETHNDPNLITYI